MKKEHGNIVWVMGPAFSLTRIKGAMQALINGYAHGLMGNALASHDLRGAAAHCPGAGYIYTRYPSPMAITTIWT